MAELHGGQRVKFQDPESFDPRIGQGYEKRGRIIHIDVLSDLIQILVDGRTFAIWMRRDDVKPE